MMIPNHHKMSSYKIIILQTMIEMSNLSVPFFIYGIKS